VKLLPHNTYYYLSIVIHLNGIKKSRSSALGLFLFAIYIIAFIPWSHNHESIGDSHFKNSCTELDQDNCHNFIFHGKNSSGCSEHSHASSSKTTCLACHSLLTSKKSTVLCDAIEIADVDSRTFYLPLTQAKNEIKTEVFHLRGPPFV